MPTARQQHPHFIFLHGWGQSVQIWHQQTKYFSPLSRIYFTNLPGHGGANDIPEHEWLDHLQQEVKHHAAQRPVILIGWSLSGQFALQLQKELQGHLAGLVLVSTTPCFRQKHDWQLGCSDEVWQNFSVGTEQQDPKLMQRFFQMMLHGDKLTRREMQQIAKEAINKQTPPITSALNTGLSFLSKLDLRAQVQDIQLPTLIIHGRQDAIVPIQAGQFLADNIPHSELHVFEDCGHAPFLTHHTAFNQLLEQWWKNISV